MMKKMLLGSAMLVATLMPMAAFAQSADATYCTALVQKYEQYLDKNSGRVQQPQSLDSRAAVEKCKAGDTSGIPAIEKALRNAKIDLPSRG
ncbi:hypothetical protein [uncultured Reyranella sp.]|uniref:hypothetical protein n=1 Tax=uncultured Reyranella sp. TaxID=735512 RepID=UPI0025E89B2E|nr:hypothetical protein [uncultured Reyranella sp.]